MAMKNGDFTRTYGAPSKDGVIPRFFNDAVLNVFASQAAGREIWDPVTMVEMLIPGNMLTRPTEKVNEEHKQRWPEAWKAFVEGEEMALNGRPLEEWPMLNKAMVKELKFLGFRTVEDLAEMTEIAIQRIGPGARNIKMAAQAFVEDAKAVAPIRAQQEENERLKSQIAAQQVQLEEQAKLLGQLNSQFMAMRDNLTPAQAYVPGQHDPLANRGAPPAPTSALDVMAKRVSNRKPKPAEAAPADTAAAVGLAPMLEEQAPAAPKRSTGKRKAA